MSYEQWKRYKYGSGNGQPAPSGYAAWRRYKYGAAADAGTDAPASAETPAAKKRIRYRVKITTEKTSEGKKPRNRPGSQKRFSHARGTF